MEISLRHYYNNPTLRHRHYITLHYTAPLSQLISLFFSTSSLYDCSGVDGQYPPSLAVFHTQEPTLPTCFTLPNLVLQAQPFCYYYSYSTPGLVTHPTRHQSHRRTDDCEAPLNWCAHDSRAQERRSRVIEGILYLPPRRELFNIADNLQVELQQNLGLDSKSNSTSVLRLVSGPVRVSTEPNFTPSVPGTA